MKTINQNLRSLSLLALLGLMPMAAHADLTWGPTGAGGAGTWNAVNTNWYDGANDVVWDSTGAVFGGAAGVVSVTGTQNATGLNFTTAGYTLQGAGTINLTGTPTISGTQTLINTLLSGSSGVTITGSSKNIGGNNTGLTGVVTIDGTSSTATVRAFDNNSFGSSAAIGDKIQITNGGAGAILQLSTGVILPKYITTTGTATIESVGSSSLTGSIVAGGNLLYQLNLGTTLTLSGSAGLGATGQSIFAGSTGRLIVDTTAAGATAYGLLIRDSATVQVNSGATLGAANVFFLGAFFGGGTSPVLALNDVTVSNNLFLDAAPISPRIENMAAGTSTISGQILTNGGNYIVNLRSTTSGTLDVVGLIRDTGAVEIGNASFANSGVVNFSRAAGNTYDGGTTVNSGTLLVNNSSGSATGTGAVTVASGATLGGSGSISGATTINGILAPGNSIGILTVANDVTWNGAAIASAATDWKFELGAANTADLLNITGGTSDFLEGSGSAFRFDFQGSTSLGTFVLVDWDGTTTFSNTDFSFTNLGAGNTGTFAFNGSQLEFTAVVPEPSSFALLLAAVIGGTVLSRKRRTKSLAV